MLTRIATRLVWTVITLAGTAILTFLLVNAVPGDVARMIAGSKASPEVLEQIRSKYHLHDPVLKRLGFHLARLVRGDLAHSFVTDQPVAEAIRGRFPCTAALASLAVFMWMLLAVPLGVFTARYRGSWFDRSILAASTLSLSLPAFWLDVPMIMGTVMFSAVIVSGANLAVDVLYGWIDPRIKCAT